MEKHIETLTAQHAVDMKRLVDAVGESAAALFFKFVQPLGREGLESLPGDLDKYMAVLRQMQQVSPHMDLSLAERIVTTLKALVSACDPSNLKQVGFVVAAVRYFIYPFDAADDVSSADGLDDDAEVVNFVILESGLSIPLIPIPKR